MALPALAKTWQLNINNVVVPDANLAWHQKLMLALKNAMIGFASNPWTVVGSSDGTNFDVIPATSNDYWTVYTDLNWFLNTPHSWIVLENVDGLQICIDLNYAGTVYPEQAYFLMSSGGLFTGGDASNRPIATDEISINLTPVGTATIYFGQETLTPAFDHVWHMWHSEDGTVTRLIGYYQDIPHTIWRFEKFQNPRTGHAVPYGCGIFSGGKSSDQLNVTDQEDQDIMRSDHGGLEMQIYCMGVGRTALNLMERAEAAVVEEISGEAFFAEIGYDCPTTGGRGPKGKAFDMWWGQHQVAFDGDTYPNSPTAREFVQMGCFVLPWTGDATVPLTR
jgi:hypothetical protein